MDVDNDPFPMINEVNIHVAEVYLQKDDPNNKAKNHVKSHKQSTRL